MSNGTLELLKGNLMKKGEAFEISDDIETIGVYFSAHWCPPCRGFTPVLAEFYKKFVVGEQKKMEIVFVSSDRDKASFDEYYGEMPWAALKYEESDIKGKLSEINGIRGIPTLVIFDKSGEVRESNGRGMVAQAGDKYPF